MTTEADDSELIGWKHFRLPMALCLLGSGAGSEARATAGAGFSVDNFSAIFAPVLSAMGTNFLGGG